jgi:hypothetical protein
MFTFIFAPIILTAIVISIVTRILLRPYWSPYRRNRFFYDPYSYRHRHRGLLSLLSILAIGRLFGRRW